MLDVLIAFISDFLYNSKLSSVIQIYLIIKT